MGGDVDAADVDAGKNAPKSNQPAVKRDVKELSDVVSRTLVIPADADNQQGGRVTTVQASVH